MSDENEMACRELVDLVSDYLDEYLTEFDRRRFEEHLAICRDCVTFVDQFRTTIAAVAGLEVPHEVPSATRDRLLNEFRDWNEAAT